MSEPNPYRALPVPATDTGESSLEAIADSDWQRLRRDAKSVAKPGSRYEPLLWPVFLVLMVAYQFGMAWWISSSSGVSFGEVLAHDVGGFRGAEYSGAFVRIFDRFVTGCFALMFAVFLVWISRLERKQAEMNARVLSVLEESGLAPPEEDAVAR